MDLKKALFEVFKIGGTVLISVYLSSHFAFKRIMAEPVPAQFVVINMTDIAQNLNMTIDASKPSGQVAIKELSEKIKSELNKYTDAGMVVLDSSQIIAAPKEAYINPEDLLSAISLEKVN